MKKILITGAGSFIGASFEKYINNWNTEYLVDTVDMRDDSWRKKSFEGYDVVFHVAGIAHADVGHASEEVKRLYYAVNTDLAVETAKKVKDAGVEQFIFMSSAIVFGESAPMGKVKIITKDTRPAPANFYGDSKLRAEYGISSLSGDKFKVVILRPPMIYGEGCKGNYATLVKLARNLIVFPNVRNQRSMLSIENLCSFVKLMIDNEESGIFYPQNSQYVCTAEMVKEIGKGFGKNIRLTKLLNPLVWLAGKIPGKISGMVNKAFGNFVYDMELSEYEGKHS